MTWVIRQEWGIGFRAQSPRSRALGVGCRFQGLVP